MFQGDAIPPIPAYLKPGERPGQQPTRVSISGIPDGYAGTKNVLGVMADLVNGSFSDERIASLARQITMRCPPRDSRCEASALLNWIQTVYRYTRLPNFQGLQRLQTPAYTLFDGPKTGECASLSVALAALLKSLGNEVGFRVGGTNASTPYEFEHVWVIVKTPDGILALDPSYDQAAGWEHSAVQTHEDYWIP